MQANTFSAGDFFEDDAIGDLPFYDNEMLSLEEYEALEFTDSLTAAEQTGLGEDQDASDVRSIESRLAKEFAEAKSRRAAKRSGGGGDSVQDKVRRRRQIDPTTCERDYTSAEVEFMNALDEYKRSSGRMFPTCSEVLEVLRTLGYEKREK